MFAKMTEFIMKHRLALLISFAGGILLVMPVIISILNIGFDNFRGVYPVMNADAYLYNSILNDVWDGHYFTGNAYYAEGKDGYFLNPSLAQIVVSTVGKTLGLSLPLTSFLSDLTLTTILFFLSYLFVYLVTRSRKISLLFLSAYILLFYHFDPVVLAHQFGLVFLYMGLILIYYIFYAEESSPRLHAMTAVVIGALFYVYPFYWTFLLTLYGVNVLARYRQYFTKERLWDLLYFSLAFLIVVMPYVVNLRGAASTGFYGETMARYGLIKTHFPACYFNIFMISLTAMGLFFATRRGKIERLKFWVALLVSLWIVNWQNVITGTYVQFSSHYYVLTAVMCLILIVSVIADMRASPLKERRYYLVLACGIFFMFLGILVYKQYPYLTRWLKLSLTEEQMMDLQSKRDLFDWLNDNTEKDSVVYSLDEQVNSLLPIYTHNNVYYFGFGGLFLASDSVVEKRWIRSNIFRGEITEDTILNEQRNIWNNKFVDVYQNYQVRKRLLGYLGISLPEVEQIPASEITRMKKEYDSVSKGKIADRIKDFSIDYILIKDSKANKKYTDKIVSLFPDTPCVKAGDAYCIYRIK